MAVLTPRISEGGSVLDLGLVLAKTLPEPQRLIHRRDSVKYGISRQDFVTDRGPRCHAFQFYFITISYILIINILEGVT